MEFRSSNTKYVHFGGDILSNVDDGSSYGVHLTGGSTAGIVQAAGDTTNINLIVRGKGAGAVTVGSSAGSTSTPQAIKGIFRSTFTAQIAAISSGQTLEAGLSTAVGGFADGDLVSVYAVVTPAEAVMTGFRMAADASTRLTMIISNPGSTATSTGRVVGTVTWLDLT